MKLGIKEARAAVGAFSKRGAWFTSGSSIMNQALKIQDLREMGLFTLLDQCLLSE